MKLSRSLSLNLKGLFSRIQLQLRQLWSFQRKYFSQVCQSVQKASLLNRKLPENIALSKCTRTETYKREIVLIRIAVIWSHIIFFNWPFSILGQIHVKQIQYVIHTSLLFARAWANIWNDVGSWRMTNWSEINFLFSLSLFRPWGWSVLHVFFQQFGGQKLHQCLEWYFPF